MQIYPSILETSFEAVEKQLLLDLPSFHHVQIDIADGIFVPSKTVQIEDLHFSSKIASHFSFEFHLMVEDYTKEIEKLSTLKMRINRILIHFQSYVKNNFLLPYTNAEYGIVLNPADEVNNTWAKIKDFKYIQIMTVHPGKQGSPFLAENLIKIQQLRRLGYEGKILLDGGINDETMQTIISGQYLPNIVCPGSYFKTDIEEHLKKLLTEAMPSTNADE